MEKQRNLSSSITLIEYSQSVNLDIVPMAL